MKMHVLETPALLGQSAAKQAAGLIKEAIASNGTARILLSTGASQFDTITNLRAYNDIDWTKVEMFHLDEYIGISPDHPASFEKYLRERFIGSELKLKKAHFIKGMTDPAQAIADVTAEIRKAPIDVALIGIGENAHVAFNDPPADFDTKEAFIIVALDEACKQQQVREGWFATLDDVPKNAITISVYEIMQSKVIISAVPHVQKATAIKNTMENDVTNMIPSTILKTHPNWSLYLDKASASLLSPEILEAAKS